MALWIQTPASPLISCVSLGRLFYLSGLVLTSICNRGILGPTLWQL